MTTHIPAERLKLKRAYEPPARGDGTRIRPDTVMQHAPLVEQEAVIARHQRREIVREGCRRKALHRQGW